MFKFLRIFILLIALCSKGYSQQYSFVNYSVEDGLAQTQVFDLESDSVGYVWIGTAGGVSRFDGKDFQNYSTENGLIDNTVKEIEIRGSVVWIASQYGITSVQNKKVVSWDLSAVSKGKGIASFTFDKNNNLWLAVKGNGVYKIPIEENQLQLDEILNYSLGERNQVKTIYCDKNGVIWVGGKNILSYYSSDLWHSLAIKLDNFTITSFDEFNKGDIICSTQKKGLFIINNKQIQIIEKSINFGSINRVFIDSQERLWISSNFGAFLLEGDEVKHFTVSNGLINNRIKNITEDREGNIWLGSDGGGIMRFTSDELVSYSKLDGFSSDYVLSIVEDYNKNIYFSTYGGGINKFSNKSIEIINKSDALGDNTIWTSTVFYDSSLWFGTANGLSILKDDKISTFKNVEWLPSNKILFLKNDEQKNIWIGTSKGIAKVGQGEVYKIYKYKENFPARNIRTIETVGVNKIWVGTSSGVFEILNDTINELDFNNKLQNKIVYTIKKLNNETTFIGTGNGLFIHQKVP